MKFGHFEVTFQGRGAGKYIKKPYVLVKIGIAFKEEMEKLAVSGLYLD